MGKGWLLGMFSGGLSPFLPCHSGHYCTKEEEEEGAVPETLLLPLPLHLPILLGVRAS